MPRESTLPVETRESAVAAAERLGLGRAVVLFPTDVAAAFAMAVANRALPKRALPPEIEPWQPQAMPKR